MFLTLLLATVLVYKPALSGPFMLDDFDNLNALRYGVTDSQSLQHYLSIGKAGPLGRPISKLSFLLDDNAWPSSPENFKRTNLLIHLLIGVLVFCASRLIINIFVNKKHSDWLALLIAAFFLTHPLQVSTTMYVVQRMTQLSGLFVMLGVVFHLYWRSKSHLTEIHRLAYMSLSIGLFTILAAFSKESGVLLPIFLLVIELTIFSNKQPSQLFLWWRRLCLQLPTIVILGYIAYWPNWISSYKTRDFTFSERLITEPVVLMDYLSSIITMRVGGLGLFHDDYPIYSSLADPIAFISLFLLTTALTLAIIYRRKFPLVCFGTLWFFAGHVLESTTISLEIYFEHRNYIPIIGALFVVFVTIYSGLRAVSKDVLKLFPGIMALFLAVSAMTTWGYANEWSSLRRIIPIWAAEHPDSPRAQRTFAQTLAMEGFHDGALNVLDDAYERFPYDLSIPVMSMDISCAFDAPQRFSFELLSAKVSSHKVTDGLRPALKSLLGRALYSSCRNQTSEIHAFVKELSKLQGIERNKSVLAVFYVFDGDLYMGEQDGNGALKSYKAVDQISPSVDSALRIAGLLVKVKDYDYARTMIQLAYQRDQTSSRGLSEAQETDYVAKFKLIDQLQTEK
jgi:tetratricopeptide (TPR) repeat protein